MNKALTLNERFLNEKYFQSQNINIEESIIKWRQKKNVLSDSQFTNMLNSLNYDIQKFGKILGDYDADSIPSEIVNNLQWYKLYKSTFKEMSDGIEYDKNIQICYYIKNFTDYAMKKVEKMFSCNNMDYPSSLENQLLLDFSQSLMTIAQKPIILQLNTLRESGKLEGDTTEDRYHFFCKQALNKDILDEFYREYPVLARLLSMYTYNFISNLEEFMLHFNLEKQLIYDTFSINKNSHISLIKSGAGDLHQRGKSVYLIEFSGGEKLVYKPKDLRIVESFNSLICWINKHDDVLPFKTYKGIYKENYAFEEFIEKVNCKTLNEVENYYTRFGQLLAVMYIVNGGDLHMENIIVNGEYPVIVDLETIFQQHTASIKKSNQNASYDVLDYISNSVMGSGLLPTKMTELNIDLSGLSGDEQKLNKKIEVLKNIGTDTMRIYEESGAIIQSAQNIVEHDGKKVNYKNYLDEILKGFDIVGNVFVKNRDELLDVLKIFENQKVRVLIRNTSNYARLLQMSYHPYHLQNWLDRENILMNMYNHISENVDISKSELEDMLDGDIPIFFNNVSSTDIINSKGEVIKDYYIEESYTKVLSRVENLDSEEINRQFNFIKLKLGYHDIMKPNKEIGPKIKEIISNANAIDKKVFLDEALVIENRIKDKILKKDNSISLLSLIYSSEDESVSAGPIDYSLYNGLSGIGVFYLYLKKVTKSNEYDEIINNIYATLKEVPLVKEDVTIITGFGSKLIFFYHYLLNEKNTAKYEVLSDIYNVVSEIEENIQHINTTDWVGGLSSILHILIKIYKYTSNHYYLTVALMCAQKIIDIDNCNKVTLGGFSHGLSSLALTFFELYEVLPEKSIKNKANEFLQRDRELFSLAQGGWIDKRSDNLVCQDHWCHGSVGIGGSRMLLNKLGIHDNEINNEIDLSKSRVFESKIITDDTLCHGNLGKIELFLNDNNDYSSDVASKVAHEVIVNSKKNGDYYFNKIGDIYDFGLFMGLSGIGYQLLRVYDKQLVPSLLFLE